MLGELLQPLVRLRPYLVYVLIVVLLAGGDAAAVAAAGGWLGDAMTPEERRDRIDTLLAGSEGLRAQINDLEFPKTSDIEESLDLLAELASDTGTTLTSFNSREQETRLGERTYLMKQYTVTLEGTAPALVTYVDSLRRRAVNTSVVDAVNLRQEQQQWILSLQLRVFTRE